MFGKRNRKENTVRIDVDWLLGESNSQASRDFPWFPRIILSLVCVLAVVWCWPYASRQWLNWEWHQQLAHSMGKQSEDVLPIMLAIHELNPSNSREMVEQLGSSDSNKRTFAYHLLEERIQQWSSIDLPPVVEITSLVESLNSDRIQSPESVLMRAQLAAQLRQLVTNQFPNAPTVIASIDAMLVQGEPTRRPREQSDRTKPKQSSAPTVATTFRFSDGGDISDATLEPPSMRQSQIQMQGPVLTSMRTPTDHSSSAPNLKLSIPRTIAKAMVVRTPDVAVEPLIDTLYASESQSAQQEPNSMNGIEKLELEELLPLLNSSQPRIARQAFNELVRRETPQRILELAIVLAQGENEERLLAMETIARDPKIAGIPWLVWMAGSGDRIVRRRAIALLGSMTDPIAIRKLRSLQSREPDSDIFDQIKQVLLASGTSSIGVR